MAIRIRDNGIIVCAAMHPELTGDTYINDGIHYTMSVIEKVIVTDDDHPDHGQWWWRSSVPDGIVISDFYVNKE